MLPLLLLAACTHDDAPASPAGIPLPPDTYPLQIASVTISADGQPRTRLTDEGNTTKWQDNDQIMVSLGDKQSIYTYTDGEWHSDNPLCWESTAPQKVNAWYPVDETIDFTHQDKGLTYLLKAESVNATYQQPSINLNFTHQLAKVRVLLEGKKAQNVEKVYVRSYPKSANNQGELGDREGEDVYVPMYKTTYEGKDCWEATLRDGTLQADNSFKVASDGGTPVQVVLDKNMHIAAGQVYTINISVNPVIPENAEDITNTTGDINDKDDYVVSGERNTTINITGGSPTIYLDGATVAVSSGNAINITGGNPTIYVVGEDNTISSGNGAGIYVTEGSTVTIKGSSRDDELTVRGGNGNSGIGGYIDDTTPANSGNINISNITLSVYGSYATDRGNISPGIGCSAEATCGTITISSATVHAFGITFTYTGYSVPGIGTGFTWVNTYPKNLPDVIVSNSEIHAHRGNPGYTCDYIGWAADLNYPSSTYANSTINLGAGSSIKSSTVYCYTGDTLDKTVEYDDQGNDTEVTQ